MDGIFDVPRESSVRRVCAAGRCAGFLDLEQEGLQAVLLRTLLEGAENTRPPLEAVREVALERFENVGGKGRIGCRAAR